MQKSTSGVMEKYFPRDKNSLRFTEALVVNIGFCLLIYLPLSFLTVHPDRAGVRLRLQAPGPGRADAPVERVTPCLSLTISLVTRINYNYLLLGANWLLNMLTGDQLWWPHVWQ